MTSSVMPAMSEYVNVLYMRQRYIASTKFMVSDFRMLYFMHQIYSDLHRSTTNVVGLTHEHRLSGACSCLPTFVFQSAVNMLCHV